MRDISQVLNEFRVATFLFMCNIIKPLARSHIPIMCGVKDPTHYSQKSRERSRW